MIHPTPAEQDEINDRAQGWFATSLMQQGITNITLATGDQITVAVKYAVERITQDYGPVAGGIVLLAFTKFRDQHPGLPR